MYFPEMIMKNSISHKRLYLTLLARNQDRSICVYICYLMYTYLCKYMYMYLIASIYTEKWFTYR